MKDDIFEDIDELIKLSEETALDKNKEKQIDVTDDNAIAEQLIKMTIDDRKQADKIFDAFYDDIALSKDSTTSSKEALNKSLELKIEAGKNIIELLKIRSRKENFNSNTQINILKDKDVGINLGNMDAHLDDF